MRVTGFDERCEPKTSKHRKVTLMLNGIERIIKHKVGLLNLTEELGNVSKACKVMGVSRDTFYRYKDAVDEGGFEALIEKDRRQPNGLMSKQKTLSLNTPLISLLTAKLEPVMSCVNWPPLSRPVVSVASGFAMTCHALRIGLKPLKRRLLRKGSS